MDMQLCMQYLMRASMMSTLEYRGQYSLQYSPQSHLQHPHCYRMLLNGPVHMQLLSVLFLSF